MLGLATLGLVSLAFSSAKVVRRGVSALNAASVHVLSLDLPNKVAYDHKLCKIGPYGLDFAIISKLKAISAPIDDADYILVPYSHGCEMHTGRIHAQIPALNVTTLQDAHRRAVELLQRDDFKLSKLLWLMSHDWGGCYHFLWSLAEWKKWGKSADQLALFRNTPVVQSMGDIDTKCHLPQKDIVIPPRTLITPELTRRFKLPRDVLSFQERELLFFFYSYNPDWDGRGTGLRFKLMDPATWSENSTLPDGDVLISHPAGETQCKPEPNNGSRLFSGFTFSVSSSSSSNSTHEQWRQHRVTDAYLDSLGRAKFCAVPAGVVGWSFRLSDVIYSGCIPVLIGNTTHHPFWDMLDYRKFSISVSVDMVKQGALEAKLRAISADTGSKLQTAAIAARKFFVYDDAEDVSSGGEPEGPVGLLLRALTKRKTRKKRQKREEEAVF